MTLISVITDEEQSLTKGFEYKDGKLIKNAPGNLTKGHIESLDVTPEQLLDVVHAMTPQQCLCLGVLEQPGKQIITCAALQKNGNATRSKEFLSFFPGESYLLLDMDESGLTPEEALEVFQSIDPQFKTTSLLYVPSSSSYLYLEDGTEILGAGNYHFYVPLEGSRDPKEYGLLLFNHLLLNGHGKAYVTKAGTVVLKSIFDKAVLSSERVAFVAPPVCAPPLISRRLEHTAFQEGGKINSDWLKDLTEDEEFALRIIAKDLRESVADEVAAKRKIHNEERARTVAKIRGTNHLVELASIHDSAIMYDKQGRPMLELLSTDVILDEQGAQIEIRDLILDPKIGLRLPDPIEPYTRGNAAKKIPGKGIATMLKPNYIYSHAHAGMHYLLRWTAADLSDFFASSAPNDEKELVWKSVAAGLMELSQSTTEGEISELADSIKVNLKNVKGAHVPSEKKHVVSKLKPAQKDSNTEDDVLLKMNAKYGLAMMEGKSVIVQEEWKKAGDSFEVTYSTPQSMDVWTKTHHMRVNNQTVSLYKWWEQHPERNNYESVEFLPNAHTFRKPGQMRPLPQGSVYNLFQGYIHDPARATECDLILQHIRDVWCSNNDREFKFTIGWLAHLFQKPDQVSSTALVLPSVPGAGKGVIISKIICHTLGIHAIATSNSEDLTGRFNAHLGVNLFFYANELSYTAHASAKSTIKTLITDKERTIEAKNVNKVKSRNYSSVIFSSNEEWLLNIEAGDRRLAYLTVSSHRVGDREYFIALVKQIENGGREAFIEYLMQYDISNFDITDIPDINQKQRKTDFLRSTHPAVRMVWSLFNPDVDLLIFATHPMYSRLKEWRDGTGNLELNLSQFFDLYTVYADYFKTPRQYDDPMNLPLQLESGGVLRRDSDPRTDFPIDRGAKGKRNVLVLKPFGEGSKLLKV